MYRGWLTTEELAKVALRSAQEEHIIGLTLHRHQSGQWQSPIWLSPDWSPTGRDAPCWEPLLNAVSANLSVLKLSGFFPDDLPSFTNALSKCNLDSLERFELTGCGPAWEVLPHVIARAPNLRSLRLAWQNTNDYRYEGPEPKAVADTSLCANCTLDALQTLDMQSMETAPGDQLSELVFSRAPNLRRISFSRLGQLSLPAALLPELTHVVASSYRSTDSDLREALSLPQLETLLIHGGNNSGDSHTGRCFLA